MLKGVGVNACLLLLLLSFCVRSDAQTTRVTAPASAAGMEIFGARFPFSKVWAASQPGGLVAQLDVLWDDPQDASLGGYDNMGVGCELKNNADFYKGKIVLVKRGICGFADKLRVVTQTGAVGMLLVNNAYNDGHNQPFLSFFNANAGGWDGPGTTRLLANLIPRYKGEILIELRRRGPVTLEMKVGKMSKEGLDAVSERFEQFGRQINDWYTPGWSEYYGVENGITGLKVPSSGSKSASRCGLSANCRDSSCGVSLSRCGQPYQTLGPIYDRLSDPCTGSVGDAKIDEQNFMNDFKEIDMSEFPDVPPPPCVDDDEAAKKESGGMVNNCEEAGTQGLCTHPQIGPMAKSLCPLTCKECSCPAAGAPPCDCKDDDEAAKKESGGMVNNCEEAGTQGLCTHPQIGPMAKSLCPFTCKECSCPAAGAAAPAGPRKAKPVVNAYYAWKGVPWWMVNCNENGDFQTQTFENGDGGPKIGDWLAKFPATKYLQLRNGPNIKPYTQNKALPDGVANFVELEQFEITKMNSLQGTQIYDAVGVWPQLIVSRLFDAGFSGPLPWERIAAGGFDTFQISWAGNKFTGDIPATVAVNGVNQGTLKNYKRLSEFNIKGNNFQGTFPLMDGIENLETVEAAQNKFTSAQGFRNMPKLKKIVLAQNQLASFPGISETPSLEEVDVQQNSIAQTLQQAGVENYPTLKRMFFHKNNISGYDDGSQTYNIAGKMQSLSEINLRDNPYLFRKVNMDLGWMQFLPNTDPIAANPLVRLNVGNTGIGIFTKRCEPTQRYWFPNWKEYVSDNNYCHGPWPLFHEEDADPNFRLIDMRNNLFSGKFTPATTITSDLSVLLMSGNTGGLNPQKEAEARILQASGQEALIDPYVGMRAPSDCTENANGQADSQKCFEGALKGGSGMLIKEDTPTYQCTVLVGTQFAALQTVDMDPEYYSAHGCQCVRGLVGKPPNCREPPQFERVNGTCNPDAKSCDPLEVKDDTSAARLRRGQDTKYIVDFRQQSSARRAAHSTDPIRYLAVNFSKTLKMFNDPSIGPWPLKALGTDKIERDVSTGIRIFSPCFMVDGDYMCKQPAKFSIFYDKQEKKLKAAQSDAPRVEHIMQTVDHDTPIWIFNDNYMLQFETESDNGTRSFVEFDTKAHFECPPEFKLSRYPQFTTDRAAFAGKNVLIPERQICVYSNCRPGWEFLDTTQVSNCSLCESGKYKTMMSAEWIDKKERYNLESAIDGMNPPDGSDPLYSPGCASCAPGFFQDERGASSCKQCRPGSYQDRPGQASCLPCPSGTYQQDWSKTFCYNCPRASKNSHSMYWRSVYMVDPIDFSQLEPDMYQRFIRAGSDSEQKAREVLEGEGLCDKHTLLRTLATLDDKKVRITDEDTLDPTWNDQNREDRIILLRCMTPGKNETLNVPSCERAADIKAQQQDLTWMAAARTKLAALLPFAKGAQIEDCRCNQDYMKSDGSNFPAFSENKPTWPNVPQCVRQSNKYDFKKAQEFSLISHPATRAKYNEWTQEQCVNKARDWLIGCVSEKKQDSRGFCVECPFCVDEDGNYEKLGGACEVPTTEAGSFARVPRLRPLREWEMDAKMIERHFENLASRISDMGSDGGSPCSNGKFKQEMLEPLFGGFPVPRAGNALSLCLDIDGCKLDYGNNKRETCCNQNGYSRLDGNIKVEPPPAVLVSCHVPGACKGGPSACSSCMLSAKRGLRDWKECQEICPEKSTNCGDGYDPTSPRCSKCLQGKQPDGKKWWRMYGLCLECNAWGDAGLWVALFVVLPLMMLIILWDTTSLKGIGSLWYLWGCLTGLSYFMYYQILWPKPIKAIAGFGAMLVFDPVFFRPECAVTALGGDSFFGLRFFILWLPVIIVLAFVLMYFIFKLIGNGLRDAPGARKHTDPDMWPLMQLLYYPDNVRFDYFWRATSTMVDYLFCLGIYHSLSMFMCNDLEDGTVVMRLAPWESCNSSKFHAWTAPFLIFYFIYGIVYPVSLFTYFYCKNMQAVDGDGNFCWLANQKRLGEESEFFRRWGYHYVWKKDKFWWYPFVDKLRWELGIIVGCMFKKYDGYQMLLAMLLLFIGAVAGLYFRPSGWELYNCQSDLKDCVLFTVLLSGIYFDTLKLWLIEWEAAYDFMAWVFVTIIILSIGVFTLSSLYEVYLYYLLPRDIVIFNIGRPPKNPKPPNQPIHGFCNQMSVMLCPCVPPPYTPAPEDQKPAASVSSEEPKKGPWTQYDEYPDEKQ